MEAAQVTELRAPDRDCIEVLLTLPPGQYRQMGADLERLREKLNLPKSTPTTQVIVEAIHRQAAAE
jgi:hypothetical protein